MSKSYVECCTEVGFTVSKTEPPEQIKQWFAYVDGKSIHCPNQAEAKKYKLHECVFDPVSKQEIVKYWDDRRILEVKAQEMFVKSLREDYPEIKQPVFDLCYQEAYKRNHSSGLDSVADELSDVIDFVTSAIKLSK